MDADPSPFQQVDKAFALLDGYGAEHSVPAGNHDVSGDDSRGDAPHLRTMGPQRFAHAKTLAGADPTGYNTAHVFRAAGRSWLLLALEWRTSQQGFAWAESVVRAHPKLPVIPTTDDLVYSDYGDNVFPYESGDPEDNAVLSAYGRIVRDRLIDGNDQIFLTLNGHYWPPARTTAKNAAGNDAHLHITNYHNRRRRTSS
ncbi:hypothetical protein ACIRBZ_06385 [Streptomyces sp. NPDC094038]|uniref:hypothetical protein n=1 Tax=Streptomyces sp. NPDC094038 TaxID=3366055 RepID=UPI0037FC0214